MPHPYTYPKVKHNRTQLPPAYTNYRKYKPHLEVEFDGKCVYCRALDKIKGKESFGVDHYRPKRFFPSLETEYLNLYYCCNRCNSLKGSFWPTPAQNKAGQFVPNPCEHVMFEHMRYRDGEVVSVSAAGEWSIELLDLNDPDSIDFRSALIKVIDTYVSRMKITEKAIKDGRRQQAKASSQADKDKMEKGLIKLEQNYNEMTEALDKLIG